MRRARKRSGRLPLKVVANPIDVHVGKRIRQQRTDLGLSQGELGRAIGLTDAQVQRYEKGVNRVSSSRLFDLARLLNVAVPWFFEDMDADLRNQTPSQLTKVRKPVEFEEQGPVVRRETIELVHAYYSISNETVRTQLYHFIKVISKEQISHNVSNLRERQAKSHRRKMPRGPTRD